MSEIAPDVFSNKDKVQLLLLDCDGVLTDGGVTWSEDGIEQKTFNIRDGLGIKLWQQAGLPEGVMTMVQGEVETGKLLAAHAGIDGIFFTGSSRTGKILHEQYAGHPGKILALELGGNNPLVVHQASDIDATAYLIIQSAFITAGQRCTCARRLILIDDEADAVLARLVKMTSMIRIGDPADETNFMGPVISETQANKLLQAQRSLETKGGKVLLKMKHIGGAYISPGIIDCTGLVVADEENFGPLLKVYRVKTWDEAIDKANDTDYGLSSGLISDSQELYDDFRQRIRAGLCNWNMQITGATSAAPFGGIGLSGNHRPSAYYAADYCSYPVASMETKELKLPEKLSPGLESIYEEIESTKAYDRARKNDSEAISLDEMLIDVDSERSGGADE